MSALRLRPRGRPVQERAWCPIAGGARGRRAVLESAGSHVSSEPMKRIKVWPAALLVVAYLVSYWGLGAADISMFSMFLGRLAGLGLLLVLFIGWWLTRRAISWGERLLVLGAGLGSAVLFTALRHRTVL